MGHFAHSGKLGGITLPLEIFRDPRLNGTDICFLVALLEYRDEKTGKTNPGGGSIEAISGISSSSVERARKRLVKFGWIKYTSGNHKAPNDYTVIIPMEAGFKYQAREKKQDNGDWTATVKNREADIASYVLKKVKDRNQWNSMDAEVLIEELENERRAGANYIPDEVLENYEILRVGDNSAEARIQRKEARELACKLKTAPGGVRDCFEGDNRLEDFMGTDTGVEEYAGYTRAQLIDMQFNGVKLPQYIIHKFNLSPSL